MTQVRQKNQPIKEIDNIQIHTCPQCGQASLTLDKNTKDMLCHFCGHYGNEIEYIQDKPILFFESDFPLQHKIIQWLEHYKITQNNFVLNNSRIGQGFHYFPKDKNWKFSIKFFVPNNKNMDENNYTEQQVNEADIVENNDNRAIKNKNQSGLYSNIIGMSQDFAFTGITTCHVPLGFEELSDHVERLIIVNHPLDYLACIQAGFTNVICPAHELCYPLTPNNNEFLATIENKLKSVENIILAFQYDEETKNIENEIARRLGREHCYRVQWGTNDYIYNEDFLNSPRASSVLLDKGEIYLKQCIKKSRGFPINGIYELDDVNDEFEVLYNCGLKKGFSTGWPIVDEHYTVAPGQWTLITGIPGHGKSNWLDALLVNMAQQYGWKFGIFSPENLPVERHFAALSEKYIGKPFLNNIPNHPKMSPEEKDKAKYWINEHFKSILPEEDMNWSIEGILDLAKKLVLRYGIRGLVIDPWNELDHTRDKYLSETEHISKCLTKIRRFAKAYSIHIWVIAHPTKLYKDGDGKYPVPTLYDVSGGAHWYNKADNGVTVWRNIKGPDKEIVDVHVQKIKFKEIGKVGMVTLRSDDFGGTYIDDVDQNLRIKSHEAEEPFPTQSILINQPRNQNYSTNKEQQDFIDSEDVIDDNEDHYNNEETDIPF